jgi:integrase
MRGHIEKRGKDSYSIKVSVGKDAASGKYKSQWVTVRGTKKDAEKRLSEMLNQLDNGTFMKPTKTTLAEYLERWLRDYAKPNLGPRTFEGYESIVRCHLIPALGNLPLAQLRPEHLQKYYSKKLSGGRYDGKGALNQTTVSHHHTCLHRALKMAVRWGIINRNPADAVTPPRPKHSEMHTMNEDELQAFLEAANKTPYYVPFYLALFTGMRRSELLALRWCDTDLLICQVHVTRALHQLHDGSLVFRQPKTTKGRRMIALSPSLALVLKEHKEKQVLERVMLGTALKDDDLVFSRPEGKPLLPDTISHAWNKIVKRAGLNHFRLHDARHTHASLMLKQGAHPKIVQERLGHATISTTLDLYSHVAPGLQEAVAKRFDEVLGPRRENQAVESQ